MRILIATDRLSLRGGADQHLRDVLLALVDAGHSVRIAAGRLDPDAQISGVPCTAVRALARMVPDTRQLSRLSSLLPTVDVVHVQNVMNPEALALLVGSGKAVVTVQDHRVFCPGPGRTLPDERRCTRAMSDPACMDCLPDPDYRMRALELTGRRREALRGARLIVLSRYMADELAAAGLPGAAVIPPWIERFSTIPEPGEGFLTGGRLVAHKGIDRAVAAWQLADTGMPLSVAGAGPLEDSLPPEVARLSWLSRAALLEAMRSARAVLFPSRWQEPLGILGLQALTAATPVVLFASGGTADWSQSGCITVHTIEEMAAAMRRLAADPALACALGAAGQAEVCRRFSRQRLLPRILAEYEAVR